MWRMTWVLAVSAACVGACGGKSKQGDGSTTRPPSEQPVAKACFALPSELPHTALAERAANKLGVRIPDTTRLDAEPDGFVRAQQLVDAVELELRDAKSIVSRGLLHDFILNQLLSRPELDGGRAPFPPGLSDSVATAMDSELDRVLNHWMIGGQATLASLFTDDTVFANRELADHYGIAHAPGDDWEVTHQPTTERAGILTGGALLARFPAPMTRAMHLSEAVSCVAIVRPPPGVFADSVWDDPARPSTRDIVETTYGKEVTCTQCHRYYVGAGIALDKYDELGRYRETFAGQPIDTSYFLSTPDVAAVQTDAATELEFKNPQELGLGLSQAPGVRACMVQKLNEVLGGRELSEGELACVVGELDRDDRQASLWSLMAVLAPEYLTIAP